MRRLQVSALALAISLCGAAWAGEGDPFDWLDAVARQPSMTSRAQVIAELREAQRLRLVATGEEDARSATLAEERMIRAAGDPPAYASVTEDEAIVWGDPRTVRAKNAAEAREANQLGLLAFGEGDPPIATAEQEERIAAAGRRAVEELRFAESVARNSAK